ncbi:hypothetical protein [Mesoterricola sediminis]|uniref:Pilus assembly protein PilP n=1 Tax=Mesoterricola sediminis TaxID=2927980 RepID=A0AA48KDP7_9BACT|nr:hypothetical protein [Mesoterricola sediminis]BDU76552.1 hypothetical protein METESE_15100 [Mesoterricola sediminis]
MARFACFLPVLALSLQLGAQGAPEAPGAKGRADAPPTPALSANQGINPEDLIAARAYPYRPALQRDPFAAPSDAEQRNRGDLVDDIGVKGMVVSNGKPMAVVTDGRGNVRMLPIGYRFRDGELVAVGEKSVTFRQWDPNTTNTKVFRTVVKTFKREEGKR